MKYKLVIFDMDGLIFDTEKFYYDSWFSFTDEYNFTYNLEKRKKLAGLNGPAIKEIIAKELGSATKASELRKKLDDYRLEYLKNLTDDLKKEGLIELLDFLKANNIMAVVASSSSREKIEYLLKNQKVDHYFSYLVSGHEIENGKPNPDIFLQALDQSGFDKNEALILEDSHNGYLAAKASGIDYFIIHDTSFEKDFDAEFEAKDLREIINYLK